MYVDRKHRERTEQENAEDMRAFEKEIIYVAKAMAQFDPLDFLDRVADTFDVDLPTDKLSFHQVAVLFTLIIIHRKSDDARRMVRKEIRSEKDDPNAPPPQDGIPSGPKGNDKVKGGKGMGRP